MATQVWAGRAPKQVSNKRKKDSLMRTSAHDDETCQISVNGANFTFFQKSKSVTGKVGLAGCDVSMSARVVGAVDTSFYLKLLLNEFETAFPKIEVSSLFYDWDILMDINGAKGYATIGTINVSQEMDVIQEIGGNSHAYGGTRYVEIHGEIK